MLARTCIPVAALLTVVVACSGSGASPIPAAPEEPLSGPGDPTITVPADPEGPHALGSIQLGETHPSGTGATQSVVTASFVPDAAAAGAATVCTKAVAGCELAVPCGGAGAKPLEAFDAGAITIAGAAAPLTLEPPYTSVAGSGAPFLAGGVLRVQGSGAATAGFDRFDVTFTATQLVQASPSLAQLPRSSVWGAGALPITWIKGADAVRITVAGAGGSLRCTADDALGRFAIPRDVIKTALGPAPASTITLALARERIEIKKGQKTKGQLANATVQPTGWLSLATTSTETASFTCSGAECTGVVPPTSCQDCRTSLCKTEFDACTADATCPMLRTCLDDCTTAACKNVCLVKWPDPTAKVKNGALFKCQCTTSCATECALDCK